MAKLNAADARYASEGRPTSLRTTLLLGGKNQWAVELTLQTSLAGPSSVSRGLSLNRLEISGPTPDRAGTTSELFRALDADSDGVITKEEFLRGLSAGTAPVGSRALDAEPVGPPRLRTSDSAAPPSDQTARPGVGSPAAPRERSTVRSEQEETVPARQEPRWESRVAPQERSTVRSEQAETVSAEAKPRWESRVAPREHSTTRSEQAETVPARQEPRWEPRREPRVAARDLSARLDSGAKVAARRVMPQRAGGSRAQLQSRLGRSGSALERTLTPSEVDDATGNRSAARTSRSRLLLAQDDADSDSVAAYAWRSERLSLERGASHSSSQATAAGDTTRSSVASPEKTVVKSPPKKIAKETTAVERTPATARTSWALEAVHISPPGALEPVLVSPSQRTPDRASPSEIDFTRQIAALQAEIRQLKIENQELRLASKGTSAYSSDSGRGGGSAAAELETLRVELDDSRSQLTQKDADLKHAKSQASAKEKQVTQLRQAMTAAQETAAEEREVLERQNRQLMARIEKIQADRTPGTKAVDPTEVDQLRRENEALVEELLQLKHARSLELHGEVTRDDPEFERLRRENKALVEELAALKQAYERTSLKAAQADQQAVNAAQEAQETIEELRAQLHDSQQRNAEQLDATQQELTAARDQLESQSSQLEAALAQVSRLEQHVQESSSQLAAAQDARTAATAQLSESMATVAELEERCQKSMATVAELEELSRPQAREAAIGKVLEYMGAGAVRTRARSILRTALSGWRVTAHVALSERRAEEHSKQMASAADKLRIDKIELIRRLVVGRDKYRNLRSILIEWRGTGTILIQ
eukprot:COSAG02_NODE_7581_length_2950_cov_1.563662_1_plen_826_part_00